jgi:hypothetical protein
VLLPLYARVSRPLWTGQPLAYPAVQKSGAAAHWRENSGRVPAFGGITGYVLVLIPGYGFDFGLPYSAIGERSGAMQKVERLGVATLGTRRSDVSLTGMLKDSLIRVIQAG